ncbi:hypothetical protein ASPZODRAFT_57728 [Penicilliopsis zonata CBS 506.65]|uniref:ChrR-like cupin domain-containing protein n=1 Tax=Penicilliopsis zonata CBS 506.65 TaxID=1073090 RepID=A0A1L9STD3_9EURO|nr:hypothetical protein ASPZODRAFT_57728 [Penicilliopsis zonata CBS 506.65]OJJ50374.1 hypothetical protein ASPZODRAFT_57728 [Penicilliopsis zonata CBS 506.65]
MTRPDAQAIPYQGPPLPSVPPDLVVANILDLESFDKRYWVPQAEGVWFRPLLFNVSQGYFVNLLRVRRSGILSRHRHTGPVAATTLKGRWHYLEHEWWAEQGSFSYEPPGDIHTLEVPDGVDETIVLFHVTGAYIYVDPLGEAIATEDVFSKLATAKEYYKSIGLEGYEQQFIR